MMDKCNKPNTGILLHAYELNLLDEDDRDRFEAHVLECEHCYRELKSFAPHGIILAGSEEVKKEIEKELARESVLLTIWRNLWPGKPLIYRPVFLLILVVLLIWPAVLGMKAILNGHSEETIARVQKIRLTTLRSNGDTSFEIDKELDGLMVISCPEVEPGEEYLVEVVDSAGKVLFVDSQYTDFNIFKNAELLFPHERMILGDYAVVVSRVSENEATVLYRYDFRIK